MNINYLFFGILVFFVIFIIFRFFLIDYKNYNYSNPLLIPNTVDISKGSITYSRKKFFRSLDQKNGIEYTYAFWLYIKPFSSEKPFNVFVKGIPNDNPNCYNKYDIQSPGVWVQKSGNEAKLIVSTNIFCSDSSCPESLESLNLNNIPIEKWTHLTISMRNKFIDVYLNGQLIKQHKLTNIPKQNYNDFIVGACNNLNGMISGLQYFNSAISHYEIEKLVNNRSGPLVSSTNMGLPPYLSQKYYIQND